MRLRLHNIGPVRDADVLLRRLTLLVGPNGSGKTTLSAVAYAAGLAAQQAFFTGRRQSMFFRERSRQDPEEEVVRAIERWEDQFRRTLQYELERCVTRDLSMLGREGRKGKGAAPRIYVSSEPAENAWCLVFRLDADGLVVERSNKDYVPPRIDRKILESPDSRAFDSGFEKAVRGGELPRRTLYFPAARSGFMQTFGALTALVFGALGGGYFDQATVGAIPGTAADFLRFLAQLRTDQLSRLDQEAVNVMEGLVLGGKVRLESEETARQVVFQPDGFSQAWPIESAATSAAELAPLILYLRHYARGRDGVFIDEPEAHFHPASQVPLARGLLQMARHLQYVVIATHSEFLVGELSNLLLEQRVPAAKDGPAPRTPVEVYEFCPGDENREGVNVKRLEFDPTEGFDIEQFSRVTEKTYARAVELYDAVHDRNAS